MDRNLALEFVRVTEAAAIAAARFVGRGDKNAADQAAVEEMRARFNQIDFCAEVVIGEGEKDEAPMLYTGERFCMHERNGGTVCAPENLFDIAVDPLECTDSVAYGRYNALTVIVVGQHGKLLKAPDLYMNKAAVGPKARKVFEEKLYGVVIGAVSVREFLVGLAATLGKDVSEITVVLLERPRHETLMREIRSAGARVRTLTDGDVAGAIAPSLEDSGIDCLLGIGASTEAVLAAGGIRTLGGSMAAVFSAGGGSASGGKPFEKEQIERLNSYGIIDTEKVYFTEDLAGGDYVTFTATGVIDGPLLSGVKFGQNKITTHSVVMRAKSSTVRYITSEHAY
ncbi:MAG TPA: class II fructose-bisphosphatase [Patescibacteria group bacterium]|nr:class II fructose-bisphosphatase [Patescibacteria group bacterium]